MSVDCYDIAEFNGEYERYLENTIILKRDGTYWACGIGLGGEKKVLDRYWEVDNYEVECTSSFVQINGFHLKCMLQKKMHVNKLKILEILKKYAII